MIFGQAVLYAAFGTGQLLRPTPHHRKSRWEKMAKRLRRDASEVRLCGGEKFADHLLAAACAYEQLVWNPITDSGGWLFVASGGRDAEARGFSVLMAGQISSLFRSPQPGPLYGTVATIASVALERRIKPDAVIEWCNGLWGKRLKTPH